MRGAARRGAPWGGKPQKTSQSLDRQYKAPTDNTKPQQTIRIRQNPKILDKDLKYSTRVATNIILA